MVNNGHSLQLNFVIQNSYITSATCPDTYKALQFHFHWHADNETVGSEHQIDGKAFPLEMHIVHMNTKHANVTEALKDPVGLAVLGFVFEVDKKGNDELDKFLPNAKNATEDEVNTDFTFVDPSCMATSSVIDKGYNVSLNLAKLIGLCESEMGNFYRYNGSLTTPPCSESVVWTIFKDRLKITSEQLEMFWKLTSHNHPIVNHRETQALNGRSVYYIKK